MDTYMVTEITDENAGWQKVKKKSEKFC